MTEERYALFEEKIEDRTKHITIVLENIFQGRNISVSVSLCLQHLTYKIRNSKLNWKMTKKEKGEVMLKLQRNSIKASSEIEKQFRVNYSTKV